MRWKLPGIAGLILLTAPAWAQMPQRAPWDGVWRGQAQGGNCAPLDVQVTIESGLLDGTATEPDPGPARVQGKKGERRPPPPALWQLNGQVQSDGTVTIIGLRSMVERQRQHSRWRGAATASTLRITETEGPCRRTANLQRQQ